MIKDIKYNGYTSQPSDYECSDGQLATSLNLISEDSQLKPLLQPIPTSIGLSASQKAVYIHGTSAYKHYILLEGKTVSWLDNSTYGDTASTPTVLRSSPQWHEQSVSHISPKYSVHGSQTLPAHAPEAFPSL